MKKIIYIFSAAFLCMVSCTQGLNVDRSALTTDVAPQQGDLALVNFSVTVPETPLYSTETRAAHPIGEQPNSIENGDLYVAVFGQGSNGLGGQLQHFVKATLMKDPSSWEANFYTVYFQAMKCKIGEIAITGNSLGNSILLQY